MNIFSIRLVMQCPPGLLLNPRTLRCVRVTGKVGRNLYRQGYVQPAELQYAAAAVPYGYAPWRRNPQRPALNRQTHKRQVNMFGVPLLTIKEPTVCPPGFERNPVTQRCIKIGGPTHKKINPRVLSEPSGNLPLGTSGPGPMADKAAILAWTGRNCKFTNDLLSGVVFADDSAANLQSLVRLHDGTCLGAPALNQHVIAQHKLGKIATLPHAKDTHMTLGDFKALRETMRRTVPGYKIPARTYQPPPPEWQLYVASDQRSGPEFMSVLYVDVTKARSTAMGVEYPLESIRSDLGYLPVNQTLLALVQRLASMNRLLAPVAGGWAPLYGFPYSKSYWSTEQAKRQKKLSDTLLAALAL